VTAADVVSPSPGPPGVGAGPAYELTFLLDGRQAREVEAAARGLLAPDPHGDPALGGAYRITTLYFDAEEPGAPGRTPACRRHTFRARRYGSSPWAFLERRTEADGRVATRRTPIREEELPLLARQDGAADWPGGWFRRRLRRRRLAPACRVVCERTAFAGWRAAGPVRLTLDRRVRGVLTGDWRLTPLDGGRPLLEGGVLLGLKFRPALPAPFRILVQDLRLSPSAVSPHRLCREAFGPPPACREDSPNGAARRTH
jgi:hypothetical protein